MKSKLLAGALVCGGILFSSGAWAAVACSTLTTLGALQGAGSCTDPDADLLLTFNATSLPLTTQFDLIEVETGIPGNPEFYALQLDFPGGLIISGPALTFDYNLTTLNGEFLDGVNFDTNVQGAPGFVATKNLYDIGVGTPFLTLTSTNGSHDPPAGGETPFSNRTAIRVLDTLGPNPNGVYLSTSNSYETTGTLLETPEPATLLLLGLGLVGLGFGARRKS
jgi:hypothetical protein